MYMIKQYVLCLKQLFPNLIELLFKEAFTCLQLFSELLLQ